MSRKKIKRERVKNDKYFGIYFPEYNQEFFITNDIDTLKEKLKYLGWIDRDFENLDFENNMGYSFDNERNENNIDVLCVYFTKERYDALIHELIHAVFKLLGKVNIYIDPKNNEILCYMVSYLFKNCYYHFNKKERKKQ